MEQREGEKEKEKDGGGTSPLSMPACESPKKTPGHHSSPLPPLSGDKLEIPKRRKLEPEFASSPLDRRQLDGTPNSVITPQKSRSISTPTHLLKRRTPSLADKPIPVLSPPSPALSTESHVSKTPPIPSSVESRDSGMLTAESSSSSSSSERKIGASQMRSVTSPLMSRGPDNGDLTKLRRESAQLDREIRKWRRLVDLANKAQKYEEQNRERDIKGLIEDWRSAARMAANHLYNETSVKVDAMGGVEELKKRINDSPFQDERAEFDPQSLSPEDRAKYEDLKAQYEQDMGKKDKEEEEVNEFTMPYMLKLLNVDHKLLFPEEYQ
ncbi:hypothetical protein TRICI_006348 [Trichomonascus ciferrii]|uniref:Uncharacterized protein n=1 Tax=Trichomonascus ciferrii TaxID=44093 RepID=A0A642UI05_9ASCO|nr:hypothetical protein TRICI_006348 [Trichomonascus ciferrii]